jgi:hypothetical protein
MGYVYLILEEHSGDVETYKIGISKNDPNLRLKQLSTGNSNKIRIVNVYESDNYKKIEGMLHRKYSSLRANANNEWFHLDDESIFSFIDECKKADETISFLKENNPFYK